MISSLEGSITGKLAAVRSIHFPSISRDNFAYGIYRTYKFAIPMDRLAGHDSDARLPLEQPQDFCDVGVLAELVAHDLIELTHHVAEQHR